MTVRNLVIRYGALCAEKNHSSLGGRKAHLNFELKDAPKARGLVSILDFKVQIRSGQPHDERNGVTTEAIPLIDGAAGKRPQSDRPQRLF
jgi:hypothetical protein